MKFKGLAFRLTIILLAGFLVVFSVSFLYTYNYTRNILLKEAEERAALQTSLTVSKLETVLKPLEQIPNSLAAILGSETPDPYRILLLTQRIILENPLVFGSCIAFEPDGGELYAHYIFETGSGLGSKQIGPSGEYLTSDWYRLPKEAGRPVWIGPHKGTGEGDTLICTYSVPLFEKTLSGDRFDGVLTMDISLTALSGIVSSIRLENQGIGFLLSAEGRLVTSPRPETINRSLLELVDEDDPKVRATIASMEKGETGFIELKRLWNNEQAWLYYNPVRSTGWSFGVIFPEDELFADLQDFFTELVIIFFVSVLAVAIVIGLISRSLTRPLTRLALVTQQIGKGDFQVPLPGVRSRTEIGELAGSFARMQESLGEYTRHLREVTAEQERISGELRVARAIQTGLLPAAFPDRPEMDLFASLIPARMIGGDLYDFWFLDEDRLFAAIGDVSGKGIPAALFMTITRTLLRSQAASSATLSEMMRKVNEELCRDNPGMVFVTCVTAIYHLRTGLLELCNAGHEPPLVRHANGLVRPLRLHPNLPLGVESGREYSQERTELAPGDQVILYSDGIPEAGNLKGEFYTRWRFERSASFPGQPTAREMVATVMDELRSFTSGAEPSDDMTLLVLSRRNPDGIRELRLKNRKEELIRIREAVAGMAAEWGMPSAGASKLNLALEEIFVNIIDYAFEDGGEHEIRIRLARKDRMAEVTVEDDGQPFNILESNYENNASTVEEKSIGGEGIRLVRELTDQVEYARSGELNRVVFRIGIKKTT